MSLLAEEVRSVRDSLGKYDILEHTKGAWRVGYISLDEEGNERTQSTAGHFHFDTPTWYGLSVVSEIYAVVNLGLNQDESTINPDFLDKNGKSFALFSELYLNAQWQNIRLKLGRQSLDTPHADSDDIRLMPNYFEAYTLENTDLENMTIGLGYIRKMAGWENGVDSATFVPISETLESAEEMNGVYFASIAYEGLEAMSLSLWYYLYDDIASVVYVEADYELKALDLLSLVLGVQYDYTQESGKALLGRQNARTYGLSIEGDLESLGLSFLGAYNEEKGEGAMALSLGGGAFFTSMEDQTLDAIGEAGRAWVAGISYDFHHLGLDDFSMGMAYGDFKFTENLAYHVREIDTIFEYNKEDNIIITASFASIKHLSKDKEDYEQFRLIAHYHF